MAREGQGCAEFVKKAALRVAGMRKRRGVPSCGGLFGVEGSRRHARSAIGFVVGRNRAIARALLAESDVDHFRPMHDPHNFSPPEGSTASNERLTQEGNARREHSPEDEDEGGLLSVFAEAKAQVLSLCA